MAKFIQTENNYRIYALDEKECTENYRLYPTLVAWKYDDTIGIVDLSENETETLEEMVDWCRKN